MELLKKIAKEESENTGEKITGDIEEWGINCFSPTTGFNAGFYYDKAIKEIAKEYECPINEIIFMLMVGQELLHEYEEKIKDLPEFPRNGENMA